LDRAGTGLLSGSPGKEAFFIDSWKFLTRNPHKLFLALEYVPASGGKIVTHNAYLENGTVSCRQGFLRPAHVDGEILAKFSRQDQGTSVIHRQALERIAGRWQHSCKPTAWTRTSTHPSVAFQPTSK
jgi:hypothetical protein